MSTSSSSISVAKECRIMCGVTCVLSPAISASFLKLFLTDCSDSIFPSLFVKNHSEEGYIEQTSLYSIRIGVSSVAEKNTTLSFAPFPNTLIELIWRSICSRLSRTELRHSELCCEHYLQCCNVSQRKRHLPMGFSFSALLICCTK